MNPYIVQLGCRLMYLLIILSLLFSSWGNSYVAKPIVHYFKLHCNPLISCSFTAKRGRNINVGTYYDRLGLGIWDCKNLEKDTFGITLGGYMSELKSIGLLSWSVNLHFRLLFRNANKFFFKYLEFVLLFELNFL